MATKLKGSVDRLIETADGAYIVRMTSAGLMMREPGKRTWYGPMSWGGLFVRGAQQKANDNARERARPRRVSRNLLG